MVMQAQPTQGMSISDILKIAQMAKANQQKPTVDVPSPVEMTYIREGGSPFQNGVTPPVPPTKPEEIQKPEGSGSLSSILEMLKDSTLGGWLVNKLGG